MDAVDFIWADVQGAEADLVLGGRETLKRTRFFYTEYSNRELYEGQADLGQLLAMLPDFELVHRYQGEVHQYQGDVLLRAIGCVGIQAASLSGSKRLLRHIPAGWTLL